MDRLRHIGFGVAVLAGLAVATAAAAQDKGAFGGVIRIDIDAFGAGSGQITFSELAIGSINPIMYPGSYGAPPDGVTVGFGGYFEGQAIGTRATCPAGAAVTGCVVGDPLAPLRLAMSAPATVIRRDNANPRSPALSGSPIFNGPVSFVFDRDVAGVGLAGGFFDVRQSTAIRAFDRQGRLIGGVRNLNTGMDYMALVTEDGTDRIAGVQFSLVGAEGAGFAIDDVSFARSGNLARENIEGLKPPPDQIPEQVAPQVMTLVPGIQVIRPLGATP
jgi:hypothetical protein